jgi:hypothetical protein
MTFVKGNGEMITDGLCRGQTKRYAAFAALSVDAVSMARM